MTIKGDVLISKDRKTDSLMFNGYNDAKVGFKLSENGRNMDLGWDWNSVAGSGAYFRAATHSNAGRFGFYARSSSGTVQLIGDTNGTLTWNSRRVVTATNSTQIGSATKPVYVNSSGYVTECTNTLEASVPSNAVFTDTDELSSLVDTNIAAIPQNYDFLRYNSTTQKWENARAFFSCDDSGTVVSYVGFSTASDTNGFISVKDASSNDRVTLFERNGGHIWIGNASGNYVAGVYVNTATGTGAVEVCDSSGVIKGQFWVTSAGGAKLTIDNAEDYQVIELTSGAPGGIVNVKDATGNTKVSLHLDSNGRGRVLTDKMSVSDPSYTITKSSGNWSVDSVSAKRTGNVVMLVVVFKGNGSQVTTGSNAFVGTVTGALPALPARLVTYNGSSIISASIETDGAITVRVAAANITLSSSSTTTLSGTFIVDD